MWRRVNKVITMDGRTLVPLCINPSCNFCGGRSLATRSRIKDVKQRSHGQLANERDTVHPTKALLITVIVILVDGENQAESPEIPFYQAPKKAL